MTGQDVNAALSVVVICTAGLGFATWLSPRALVWVTMRLHARAGALQVSRRAYSQTHASLMQEPLQGYSGPFSRAGE